MHNREASAKGGRARSARKRAALLKLQEKNRARNASRVAALAVPSEFESVHAFLADCAKIARRKRGGIAAMSREIRVDRTTGAKYLKASIIPSNEKFALLVAWHSAQQLTTEKPPNK